MVVLFCIKEIYVLWKLGVAYFYNGWNYLAVFNYWIYFIGFGFRVSTRVHVHVCELVPVRSSRFQNACVCPPPASVCSHWAIDEHTSGMAGDAIRRS
jgi:hypothetical protein